MKDNDVLGFTPMVEGELVADAGGSLTVNATIGVRATSYRVYAYLFHHEQDASREGKRDEAAARGSTYEDALSRWRLAALRRGWSAPGVEAVYSDMLDEAQGYEDE